MTGVLLSVFVVGAVLLALLVDVAVAVGWLNNRLKIKPNYLAHLATSQTAMGRTSRPSMSARRKV